MNKVFADKAWEDYQFWIENDRKILRKINALLIDIEQGGHSGVGKPEPLKHDLEGYWSRRITDEHRLVYSIEGNSVLVAKCKKHY